MREHFGLLLRLIAAMIFALFLSFPAGSETTVPAVKSKNGLEWRTGCEDVYCFYSFPVSVATKGSGWAGGLFDFMVGCLNPFACGADVFAEMAEQAGLSEEEGRKLHRFYRSSRADVVRFAAGRDVSKQSAVAPDGYAVCDVRWDITTDDTGTLTIDKDHQRVTLTATVKTSPRRSHSLAGMVEVRFVQIAELQRLRSPKRGRCFVADDLKAYLANRASRSGSLLRGRYLPL